ncbi:MAG: translocation/assembly module TamB domain-containing protein [Pseudomonadota bacterium]|nr:translocation/assembly module TamB domain-containing protein [Pseudomonadota bacterium]
MLRWFMRRIRRVWLLLLFIVLLIPVALWITASTERGSRWLINSTLHLLPADVSIQQIDGTLLDSLTLAGIQFSAPPHQGSLKKAHLQWQPAALLKRKIHIVDLTVDGLLLDIGETESSSEPAQIPQLPMAIDLDSVSISNTEVTLQGETHRIDSIELSAHTRKNNFIVESLSVSAEPLKQAALKGEISLLAPYPLDFSFNWEGDLAETGLLKGEGALQGDLDALTLDHRLTAPVDLSTRATITLKETPKIDLQGEWKDLSWPLSGTAEYQSPQGEFTLSGTTDAYQVSIDAPVTGSTIPDTQVSLVASGDKQGLQLAPLSLELLNGRLTAEGKINWADNLAWDLMIAAENIQPQQQWPEYAGELSGKIALKGELIDSKPQLSLEIQQLSGTLRDYDIAGAGKAQWASGKLDVEHLMLQSGENQVKLNGVMGETLDFDFKVEAPALKQLWPTLTGSLQAEGKLQGTLESPRVEIHGSGSKLALDAHKIGALKADIVWAPDDPSASTTDLQLKDVVVSNQTFSKIMIKGPGNLAQHQLELKIVGNLLNLDMQLKGGYAQQQWSGEISEGTIRVENAGSWKLSNAVEIVAGPQRLEVQQHCWKQQKAELCANGKWQQDGSIQADAKLSRLPLALLQPLLPPGEKIEGRVSGTLKATGTVESPQLEVEMELPTARYLAVTKGAQPNIDLRNAKASTTLQSDQLNAKINFDVRANERGAWGEAQGELQVDLSKEEKPIEGKVTLDVPDLTPLLARTPKIRDAKGSVHLRAAISGSTAAPLVTGDAELKNGAFMLPDLNLNVTQISLQAKADQSGQVRIKGGASSGKGKLNIDGTASIDPQQGFPFSIDIRGKDVLVAKIPEAEVLISPDLKLSGGIKELNLSGNLDIPKARIQLRDIPPTAVDVSEDTVIIHRGKKVPQKESGGVVMALNSNIEVTLGDQVSFKGFGLTTDIRGVLHVSSEAQKPALGEGQLSLHNGEYAAYGQNLSIERGNILFDGPVDNPRLDIRAFRARSFDGVRAGVAITGNVKNIKTKVFTEPPKSETEALSYLLGGGGAFEQSSVALGKYLTPRLYVGYVLGLFDSSSVLVMRYKLTKTLSLETMSGDQQSVDLYYNIERQKLFKRNK